ncbi:MAG: C-GCAxxG-C-C family protein, partial [Methanomicrobiales archaeon]|nr:C-GCAxxG-C-C family protein [Methanomicrobiales archaeon]
MPKRSDEAVAAFSRGASCSMAVFSAYAPDLGLDRETAESIASPFGAGISRTGDICGAVSGALMVIGLARRKEDIRDAPSREKVYALAREFMAEFSTRNGSVMCTDLVGYDLSRDDEYALAREEKAFATRCPKLVRDAA